MIQLSFATLLALSAAFSSLSGQTGYEGQPGNQGNGQQGYEGQPGNQGGGGSNAPGLLGYEGQPGNQGGR
jgi:hypothetical protein